MRYGFSMMQRHLSQTVLVFLTILCSCGDKTTIRPFTSDGCTLFPDKSIINRKSWCDCCFQHDIAYWQGGTETQRKQADLALKECVYRKTGDQALADLMYQGVRLGGSPYFPNWYRWGYGWPFIRPYGPLTDAEKALVKKHLEDYFSKKPHPVCN